MVENNIKKYLSFLKLFKELSTNIVNASNHTKYVSLSNQQWKTQPTLINLYPKKYSHGSCYYSFEVNLGRCVGSCNTFNDLSNKVFVPNKRFKSKSFLRDNRNEWNENINKVYIMWT